MISKGKKAKYFVDPELNQIFLNDTFGIQEADKLKEEGIGISFSKKHFAYPLL